jgi:hypothetical protein
MSDDKAEFVPEEDPLPKSGDLPLKEPGFRLYAPTDWSARAWAFKRAADILASHVLATYAAGDLLIYPIVFLYRHQLELSLKEIILRANQLLDEPVQLRAVHSLRELWDDGRTALECAGFSVEIAETEHFEACIEQLDRLDPQSMSFRYPVTKTGAPTLPPSLQSIDLQNLQTVMDRMGFFLDITREVLVQRTDG